MASVQGMAMDMIERSVQWRLSLQVVERRLDKVDASGVCLHVSSVAKALDMSIIGEALPRRLGCSAKIAHAPKPPMHEPPSEPDRSRLDTAAQEQLLNSRQHNEKGRGQTLLLCPLGQDDSRVPVSHRSTAKLIGSPVVDAGGKRHFLWGEGMAASLGNLGLLII